MFAEFQKHGVAVIGVSMDSLESHRQFAADQGIPYPLISDPEGEVARLFGVPTEGGYAERVTFLIDENGQIAQVWPEVEVAGHADEVLAAVRALE